MSRVFDGAVAATVNGCDCMTSDERIAALVYHESATLNVTAR